jgi:hypothetical protein
MILVVILDPDPDFLPIPDPEFKKAPNPGPESATLLVRSCKEPLQGLFFSCRLLILGSVTFWAFWIRIRLICNDPDPSSSIYKPKILRKKL